MNGDSFKVGDRISENGKKGTVVAIHSKGTIDVQFDHLDFPKRRQEHSVRRTNPSRKAEIQQMINTAPPAWKQMFKRYKLGNKPTVDKLIETVLEYTPSMRKYGDRGDAAHTPPKKVRDEAMKGVVLSHRHNYTSASGIGLVRAMQLVVKPKIWDRSVQRMSSYFERHIRDQESANFGNDKNPSRGYMAWLNWGGDSGKDWADNIVNRHSVSNPAPGYQSWQWRQQDWRSVIISGSKIDYSKKCGAAGTKLKNGKPRLCLPLLALDELIKTPSGRKILRAQARKKEKAKKGERVPWHPEIKRLHRLAEQGIEEDDPRKRANPIALNSYSTPYKEEDMSYTELDSPHRSTKMAIIYRRNSALVPSMADRTPQEGKLTAAERASFPKKAFVFPSRAPGPGSYPIPNIHYAKLALNMASWSEKGKEELPEILPIVLKKYPQLKNWSHIDRYYDIADEESGYRMAANPRHRRNFHHNPKQADYDNVAKLIYDYGDSSASWWSQYAQPELPFMSIEDLELGKAIIEWSIANPLSSRNSGFPFSEYGFSSFPEDRYFANDFELSKREAKDRLMLISRELQSRKGLRRNFHHNPGYRRNMASKKHGVAELKEAYRKEHGPQWFLLPKVYATYKDEKKALQTQGRAAARAKSGKGSTKGKSIALTGTTGYDCYPRKSNPSIRVEVRGVRSPYHLVAIEQMPMHRVGGFGGYSHSHTFDKRYRTKKEAQAAAKELRALIRDGGDWRSLDSMKRFNPKKKRKVASKRRSTAKRKTRKPTAVACPKCKRKTHTWNSFRRAHAGMYTQTQLSRHWKQYKRKHGRK